MRRLLLLLLCLAALSARAQLKMELHYDYGHLMKGLHNRPSMTSTVEYFGLDKWGSNYFFVDIDYYHDGVAGAYWEVAREFNLSKKHPLGFHIEYNGGAQVNQAYEAGSRFQHAFLTGLSWNFAAKDYSRTFSLQALYKYYFPGRDGLRAFNSFQLTGVWGMEFLGGKLNFCGFADLWYDHQIDNLVFVSEPQLWFNINRLKGCEGINLSIGGEVEISNNFVYPTDGTNNRFYAIPTTAVKWTF